MGRALWNWDQRLRWRLTVANQPKDQWGFLKVRSPLVSPCETSLLALSKFLVRKSARRFTAFRHAALGSWTIQSRSHWQRWWLCFGPETCVYTGDVANFEQALTDTLKWIKLPDFGESVVHGFVDIVLSNVPGHLEDNEKTSFLRSILQPLRGRVQNVFSKLKCTVKTHKRPGPRRVAWHPQHCKYSIHWCHPFYRFIYYDQFCLHLSI